MKSTNLLLCLTAILTTSAFASTTAPTSSTKATIECSFSDADVTGNYTPKSFKIEADLSNNTAKVTQKDTDNESDGNTEFSVLTNSRASDGKDREALSEFIAFEDWGNTYKAPSTLVIAGNNGDDTDQTIVVQYRPSASTEEEMNANRAKGDSDFTDVNAVYMQSVDGSMSTGKAASCKMSMN